MSIKISKDAVSLYLDVLNNALPAVEDMAERYPSEYEWVLKKYEWVIDELYDLIKD